MSSTILHETPPAIPWAGTIVGHHDAGLMKQTERELEGCSFGTEPKTRAQCAFSLKFVNTQGRPGSVS